jgi:5-methylcytosine-specific restriction endonuclease McrA
MAEQIVPHSGPIVTRAEAVAAGLPRYFTGKPCKQGHVEERNTDRSYCYECVRQRALAAYRADPASARAKAKAYHADNRDVVRERNRTRMKVWRDANLEEAQAKHRAYCEANREAIAVKRRARVAADPTKTRAWAKAWAKANPEKVRAYKSAHYQANRERYAAQYRAAYEADPKAFVVRARNRKVRKKGAEGSYGIADVRALFAAQKGRCAYCRTGIKDGYEVDHIQPPALGGSNWPRNLQLLCAPCNRRKSAKAPEDFAREIGRLL